MFLARVEEAGEVLPAASGLLRQVKLETATGGVGVGGGGEGRAAGCQRGWSARELQCRLCPAVHWPQQYLLQLLSHVL